MNKSLIIQSKQVEAIRSGGVEQTRSSYRYADFQSNQENNNNKNLII
jgi:hypothetical protein